MSVGLGERDFHDARLRRPGGKHSSLVAGIGCDVTLLRRGEGDHPEVQRKSRAGERMNMIRIETFELRKGEDEICGKIVEIASALRNDSGDGRAGGLAWSQLALRVVTH